MAKCPICSTYVEDSHFLENIKQLLKPNGFIAGSVPNRNSYFLQEFYRNFNNSDFPPPSFFKIF